MQATSQLGITVCSMLILNVSEPAIHHLLEIPLGLTGLSAGAISGIAFGFAQTLVTFLHGVFGEMVFKNISLSMSDGAALILAPSLVFVARIFSPVSISLNWLANGVPRLFKVQPKNEAASAFTLDEVAGIVEQSFREGLLKDASGTLSAAFEFTSKRVCNVAESIALMVHLPASASPADIQQAVAQHGYSRYILTDKDGHPTGYLHLKDVMDLTSGRRFTDPVLAKRNRRLVSVDRDSELEDALALMRRLGAPVAVFFDADGVATGVLFFENTIEELMGVIEDSTTV